MSDLNATSVADASKAEFLTFGFRTPPNPVPLAADVLASIHELHRLVRAWVKGSKPPADPRFDTTPTLLYVDLLFAFALAKVGAPDAARTLVETARQELAAEPPVGQLPVLRSLLFRCYESRIADALSNKPLAGPLPPELLADIAAFVKQYPEDSSEPEFPFSTQYVFSRLWNCSRVLDPDAEHDPYNDTLKSKDDFAGRVARLSEITDPAKLASAIRTLYHDCSFKKGATNRRLMVLRQGLHLARLLRSDFAAEMLRWVPQLVADSSLSDPDTPSQLGGVFFHASRLAALIDMPDLLREATEQFVLLALSVEYSARLRLIGVVFPQCVRSLASLDSPNLERLVIRIADEVLDRTALEQLHARYADAPVDQACAIRAQLALAGGWQLLNRAEKAAPILDVARRVLLSSKPFQLTSLDFTHLVRAYLEALGHATAKVGLPYLLELFKKLPTDRVTNTFTTKRYYSRLHLEIVEAAVLSVVRMVLHQT